MTLEMKASKNKISFNFLYTIFGIETREIKVMTTPTRTYTFMKIKIHILCKKRKTKKKYNISNLHTFLIRIYFLGITFFFLLVRILDAYPRFIVTQKIARNYIGVCF